jgi:chlorite dismutase
MSERPAASEATDETEALDLAEKGRRGGQVISLDRRLFMKFTAFGGCADADDAIAALEEDGVDGALYLDANDPQGIGLIATAEDPEYFVTTLRALFNRKPFAALEHKAELDMLGRTYSIGYEPDLEDTLFTKPRSKILNPAHRWAVWYPLQRSKKFQTLPADHQRRILAEHGSLAKRYGAGGHAADVRLACHGLDKNDNDFIVGLLGPNLHPLSAVVQEMRKTEQTSQYLDSLGPFFVGKAVWQAKP